MTREEDLTTWEYEIDNSRQWQGDDTPIVAVAWRHVNKLGNPCGPTILWKQGDDKDGLNAFLRRGFEEGCGRSNGEPFVVWTEKWVYFSAEYSHCGCQWVEALPREPTAEVKPIHVGA